MSNKDNWKVKPKDKISLKKYSIFMNKFEARIKEVPKIRTVQL